MIAVSALRRGPSFGLLDVLPMHAQVVLLDAAWQDYPDWGDRDEQLAFRVPSLTDLPTWVSRSLRAPVRTAGARRQYAWNCGPAMGVRKSDLALEDGGTARVVDEQPGGVRAVVSRQALSRPAGIGGQRWRALPCRRL